MSKIALAGNASGTGTITIESPNTNTDFTINLPAASGTLVTTGGTVTFGAGTAAAPSITNTNDTNTGIYFPAPDTIGFTEGGVESFRLNSSGEGVFAGNVTAAGNVTVAGGVRVGGITTNVYPIVSGAAVIASGTAIDFTGIPPWVKRISVLFSRVSVSGTSVHAIQIGSGSIQTSGYQSNATSTNNGGGSIGLGSTSRFVLSGNNNGVYDSSGIAVLVLLSDNTWVMSSTRNARVDQSETGAGTVTLAGALDIVRITTVNGTDIFDNGTINIMYE